MQQMYLRPRLTDRGVRRQGGAAAELALLCRCLLSFSSSRSTSAASFMPITLSQIARATAPLAKRSVLQRHVDSQPVTLCEPPGRGHGRRQLLEVLTSSNIASSTGTDGQGNATAIVTVNYQFNMVSSYLGFGSVNLQRSVAMRVQPQWPN